MTRARQGEHGRAGAALVLAAAATAVAVMVAVGGLVLVAAPPAGGGAAAEVLVALEAAWFVVPAAVLLGGCAAATVPALRRRSRVLVSGAAVVAAGALSAALALTTLVLVLGRRTDPAETSVLLAAAVGVVVVAVCAPWLRSALLDAGAALTRSGRARPDEVLASFADRVARGLPPEEVLRQLAESVRHAYDLASVEVWTGGPDGLVQAVAVPASPPEAARHLGTREVAALGRTTVVGEAWAGTWAPQLMTGRTARPMVLVPARHAGVVQGLLVVAGGPDAREELPSAVPGALVTVAQRLAVLLHNERLGSALSATLEDLRRSNEELRASRTRLVAAADAERRRIERDLHDGAQQHLVALAVNLGLARDLLAEDPGATAELLEEAVDGAREVVATLRDLAHGIYPPLLRDGGLPPALRAAAARAPVPVDLRVETPRRWATEVEAAAYFLCLEALTNVAKHAPGATVLLRVQEDPHGGLLLTVQDDGPGFDLADAARGHGLQNVADRIGAVGGEVTWDTAPGAGTLVRCVVPDVAGSATGRPAGAAEPAASARPLPRPAARS